MKLSDFDYKLPKKLLAQYPSEERDECKLMLLNRKEQTIEHLLFKDIIDFFDEGIVERPGVNPARQFRYHYLDETIWVNPETNTFIRSSVPRQETILIGLEPF